jgi:replicative DNA helicase
MSKVPTSIHAAHYARIVERMSTRRRLIQAGTKVVQSAYRETDDDIEDTLSEAESAIYGVRAGRNVHTVQSSREIAEEVYDDIEYQLEHGTIPGIEVGISNLDKILGSIENHEYVLFAGRPGFGKSTTLRWIAYELAFQQNLPVAFFSHEETGKSCIKKMAGIRTGHNTRYFKKISLAPDDVRTDLMQAVGELADCKNLYITAAGMMTAYQVRADSKKINAMAIRDHGRPLAAIIVDHIQKIKPSNDTKRMGRNHQIEEASGILKAMTLPDELHIPVIVACQLNRAVETRGGGGRPTLSDLRDSGSLEQDADKVIFTWPKTQYMSPAERTKALKGFEEGWEPIVYCVDKNRDGDTGEAYCSWNKSNGKIRAITKPE